MTDDNTLSGKIALVTGGSRNIGRETAVALARLGADVVVTYKTNAEMASETVRMVEGEGGRGAALQVDLTGTSQLPSFLEELDTVLSGWGRSDLDILVNNAGVLRLQPFDAVKEADLDAIYETDYKSVFFLTQALAPKLAEGGRVINLGSGTADAVFPPMIAYGPMKAAIHALTAYLAQVLGERGITVNAVAPGGLDDDMNAQMFEDMPDAKEMITNNTALGRIGVPSDVGSVIAMLCKPEAGFVSGTVVPIDGGYHL